MTEIDIKKSWWRRIYGFGPAGFASPGGADEKAIPGKFFEPREPRLDRQALLTELKGGAEIAGAALSNSAPVLSVRTK